MTEDKKNQVKQWLSKLEQESWQLELLVSAFTIFLLIQASGSFDSFLTGILYRYNLNDSLLAYLYLFLIMVGLSIKALLIFLAIHLLLRGFWIGTIGLRSVQADVDFDKFNYSELFAERLKKKVVSLDNMVIMLDEICSILFSLAFLVLFMLLAFGLHLVFLGLVEISLGSLAALVEGTMATILRITIAVFSLLIVITGLMYFIDYFTLGFFKKFKWMSKIYYPIYRFYGVITLAFISKSIYYYLIGRFSKRRIRWAYVVIGIIMAFVYLIEYDQYPYYTNNGDQLVVSANQYDDQRPSEEYVEGISIPSNVIRGAFLPLFIRYNPSDNRKISSNCPDFEPLKQEGLNWRFTFQVTDNGFNFTNKNYDNEDKAKLLHCICSLYEVSVNDSIYYDSKFHFYTHPSKEQKGLMTMLPTTSFKQGENLLLIKHVYLDKNGDKVVEPYASIPFWFE